MKLEDSEILNVAVMVSGRGSNLKALLEAKARRQLPRVRFVGALSDVYEPPAFDHARRHGVRAFHHAPREFARKADYERAVLQTLTRLRAQWIVLAGYMRVVGPTLLEPYAGRIVNIHPSLLPAFPGLHAQRRALDAGVKIAGCTVHFVDETIDGGPIVLQRAVEVREDDDEASLAARILEQEHRALPEALRLISEGSVRVEGRRVRIG